MFSADTNLAHNINPEELLSVKSIIDDPVAAALKDKSEANLAGLETPA